MELHTLCTLTTQRVTKRAKQDTFECVVHLLVLSNKNNGTTYTLYINYATRKQTLSKSPLSASYICSSCLLSLCWPASFFSMLSRMSRRVFSFSSARCCLLSSWYSCSRSMNWVDNGRQRERQKLRERERQKLREREREIKR